MKNSTYLLIGIALLFAGDIVTHLWFGNRYHLLFDSTKFNNIATPIGTVVLGIISIYFYRQSLQLANKQNEMFLSQNLKPHYEKRIKRIKKELKEQDVSTSVSSKANERYNGINFYKLLDKIHIRLASNTEYIGVLEKIKSGENFPLSFFERKDYAAELFFLAGFISGKYLNFLFENVKTLVIEIDNSDLIKHDKVLLKQSIKSDLLYGYMTMLERYDRQSDRVIMIPKLDEGSTEDIKFIQINKSDFRNYYEWFSNAIDGKGKNIVVTVNEAMKIK